MNGNKIGKRPVAVDWTVPRDKYEAAVSSQAAGAAKRDGEKTSEGEDEGEDDGTGSELDEGDESQGDGEEEMEDESDEDDDDDSVCLAFFFDAEYCIGFAGGMRWSGSGSVRVVMCAFTRGGAGVGGGGRHAPKTPTTHMHSYFPHGLPLACVAYRHRMMMMWRRRSRSSMAPTPQKAALSLSETYPSRLLATISGVLCVSSQVGFLLYPFFEVRCSFCAGVLTVFAFANPERACSSLARSTLSKSL